MMTSSYETDTNLNMTLSLKYAPTHENVSNSKNTTPSDNGKPLPLAVLYCLPDNTPRLPDNTNN
jgi:hypothetical protein